MGTENHNGDVTVSNSVDEMLNTLNQFESTEYSVRDVEDDLPARAWTEDGSLVVKNKTSSPEDSKKLTKKRKQILKCAYKHPEFTQEEISNKARVSETHVSRTLRNFDFVLEDERVYEAFVLGGLCHTSRGEEVEDEEVEEEAVRTINCSQESVSQGVEIVASQYGSLSEFFAMVADERPIRAPEQDGIRADELDSDEWFVIFRAAVESNSISEELERKIARLV